MIALIAHSAPRAASTICWSRWTATARPRARHETEGLPVNMRVCVRTRKLPSAITSARYLRNLMDAHELDPAQTTRRLQVISSVRHRTYTHAAVPEQSIPRCAARLRQRARQQLDRGGVAGQTLAPAGCTRRRLAAPLAVARDGPVESLLDQPRQFLVFFALPVDLLQQDLVVFNFRLGGCL